MVGDGCRILVIGWTNHVSLPLWTGISCVQLAIWAKSNCNGSHLATCADCPVISTVCPGPSSCINASWLSDPANISSLAASTSRCCWQSPARSLASLAASSSFAVRIWYARPASVLSRSRSAPIAVWPTTSALSRSLSQQA